MDGSTGLSKIFFVVGVNTGAVTNEKPPGERFKQ